MVAGRVVRRFALMEVIRMACPHLGIVGRRITFSPARTLAHEQYNQPHEYYATDD